MENNWIEKLKDQEACEKGLDWASEQESPQAAWNACERADWMLWAWSRNCGRRGSESHRRLVLCAVECARTGVKYIEEKEVKRLVKKSLDTTERWARGEESVTLNDVKNAAAAAFYAAADAAAAAAFYAADAAFYAAAATGNDAARKKALKECADIIRKIQPLCPEFNQESNMVTY